MSVTVYGKLEVFVGKQFIRFFFSVVLMDKKCVKNAVHCQESLSVSDSVNSIIIIVNFDKKRSVPKEIPLDVKVSIVKMIVIMQDDCS